MKLIVTCIILLHVIFSVGKIKAQEPQAAFDRLIREGMDKKNIPGLIAAVYYEDSLVFSTTYGFKNAEMTLPINRQTVFNLGSATKPFLGIAMGILADQQKIDWDDRVKEHYPAFTLSDPYITEEARIKDLFTHSLGIESGDLLWLLDSTSTGEMLERYALAEKIHPLRAEFHYNNLMYVIAGEVIQAVSGMHWTDFVHSTIFEPLEMSGTFARAREVPGHGNYAIPYLYWNDQFVRHPLNLSDQMGAAGNIWSNLEDMEHFLEFLTHNGNYQGKQILKPETFDYLIQSHVLEKEPGLDSFHTIINTQFRTYGIGWFQHDYRGKKVVFHPGSIDGMNAFVGFVPSENIALFTMSNLNWNELWRVLFYQSIDLWVFRDNRQDLLNILDDPYKKSIKAWHEQKTALKDLEKEPAISIEQATGTYSHPMYGMAGVGLENRQLRVTFNEYMTFHLDHWYSDTYLGVPQGRFYDLEEFFEFTETGFTAFGEFFEKE